MENQQVNPSEELLATRFGKPTELVFVDKDKLEVDFTYQRLTQNENAIRAIRKNFNWPAFGALSVSRRGGSYFVVDGAHRLKAVRGIDDIREVPCLVYDTENMQEEARQFVDINTARRAPSPLDRFRAQKVAKTPWALDLYNFFASQGYRLGEAGNPKELVCIQALESMWRRDASRLQKLWPSINAMHKDARRFYAEVLKGIFCLDTNEGISPKMWESLIREGADVAQTRIRQHIIRAGKSGPEEFAMALKKMIKGAKRTRPENSPGPGPLLAA